MKKRLQSILLGFSFVVVVAALGTPSYDIDITALGGTMSSSLPGRNAIQVAAPNIPYGERRDKQLLGFTTFHRLVGKENGLGPRFNNDSCGGCHVSNGKGHIRFSRSDLIRSSMVIKIAMNDKNKRSNREVPGFGGQLQDHEVDRATHYAIWLGWKTAAGKFKDGTPYSLRTPQLRFRLPGYNESRIRHTLLMTPAIIGPGLLEAVPEETIIAMSDPQDLNKDGISGRVHWVTDFKNNRTAVGRFGFKASHPHLEQFSCAAAFNDMGVTNPIFSNTNDAPELSQEELDLMVTYQAFAGVPYARNQDDPTVQKGKFLFQTVGCDSCHTMTLKTGDTGDERANQTIHPFTDLLLHDMGAELGGQRGDGNATGREWRTTPLWGIGFLRTVSDVRLRYLHDGRARSLTEAILWHGGEGARSRDAFKALSKKERTALIAFLESL